jgi:hypothetical protein
MSKGFDILFLISRALEEITKVVDAKVLISCMNDLETAEQRQMLEKLMKDSIIGSLTKDPVFTESFVNQIFDGPTLSMAYNYLKLNLRLECEKLKMLEKFQTHQSELTGTEWNLTIEKTMSMISAKNPEPFCNAMQHVLNQCASLREVRTLYLYLERALKLGSFTCRNSKNMKLYVFDDKTNQLLQDINSKCISKAFEEYGQKEVRLVFQLIIEDQTKASWEPDDFIVRDYLIVKLTANTTETLVMYAYNPASASFPEAEWLTRLEKF